MGNASELISELEKRCLERGRKELYERNLTCVANLENAPLVHGVPRASDMIGIFQQKALLSLESRGKDSTDRPVSKYLGLKDVVYVSVGILYPDAEFAMIFSHKAEEGRCVQASPWDAGWFVGAHCANEDECDVEVWCNMFQKYTLVNPDYRKYFVCHVSAFYGKPGDYLRSIPPIYKDEDVVNLVDGNALSRSFEVRFPGRLDVNENTLLAVFYLTSARGSLHSVGCALEDLERHGVEIVTCDSSHQLSSQVMTWVMRRVKLE